MKKITTQILILTVFMSLTVSELFAQTRIRFAKGQTSKTISRIFPASSDDFEWEVLLRGNTGQTMTATVKSRTGMVVFAGMGKTRSRRLDGDDDDSLFLINSGKATRFWLTVTIR